jgi:diguanylate cyclase (GGDEF)-like protein
MALVMLPVTVMCVLAGSVVLSHRSLSNDAVAVNRGVVQLSNLVKVRDGLRSQESVAMFDVRFAQLGVTRSIASTFLGFDIAAQVAPARIEVGHAIDALGSDSPVAPATLQSLYADIDSGAIAPTTAVQRLRIEIEATGSAVTALLAALDVEGQPAQLGAALESVRAAGEMVDVAAPQVFDLSVVWFPSPADTTTSTSAALARFSTETAAYSSGAAQIRDLDVVSVTALLARIEADPGVQAFDRAIAATLLGTPLVQPGLVLDTAATKTATEAFRGFFARDALLDELVVTATTAVSSEAVRVAATEHQGFMLWSGGAAILALASIGIALLLARSISRPLQDLAGYAHKVNEGELDAEPSRSLNHGPRETRMAFGVFTDLVANLQLLDAKANALAHCDFDDPVLREPLPGRLGQSLESSVALLSGSIVERDQLQTHLAHEATHDSLTGICNRPAAITAIEAAMHRASRSGLTVAVLFVDLNEFKSVNDSHGHEVGDEVLRQIAARMTEDLRSGDFLARLGGDEFVVVAEGVADAADATDLARRIVDTVSQPMEVAGLHITVGAAVGVALTLDGPEEPLRLLARADAAMYRAKLHDGSAIEIFDAGLQQQMIERVDIEAALTAALSAPDGGGLQLHYQPVLEAAAGSLAGVEALVRWERPDQGMLYPDSFIPIAEATNLIIALDCWVLAEATRQLDAWSTVPELADIPVAVNISGRHLLSHQLPNHIKAVLDQSGIDPHRLSIEITETVLLADLVGAAGELDAIRALGVKVAIDDFGTGYTSLAHLQQLPIDTIKIDRSFISQLNVRRGSSLVRMVTDLGHAIDINIVAEGVETSEEMQALQAIGADHLQGYLLSRPLTPTAMSAWAQERVGAANGSP